MFYVKYTEYTLLFKNMIIDGDIVGKYVNNNQFIIFLFSISIAPWLFKAGH